MPGLPVHHQLPELFEQDYSGQIPDNYIVEATSINRIKGLGLVEKASEELWTNVCNIAEEALT